VKCNRPVVGHYGPTGVNCTLSPVPDLPHKSDDDHSGEESDDSGKPGVKAAIAGVTDKLNTLSDQFAQLLQTVGTLSDRVVKAEGNRVEPIVKRVVPDATSGAAADVSDRVHGGKPLLLPRPSWKSVDPKLPVVVESSVNTQTLARDRELARLLDEYQDDESGDLLRAQDTVNARSLGSITQGELRQKKPLLIPDYITSCHGIGQDDEDIELLTSKGPSVKLQGKSKKPDVKNVTIAQWVSANITILELLMPTFSAQELKDYLSYTKQIGDLMQIYTSEAILTYDNEHRRDVCRGNRRWCEVSQHMVTFYLSQSCLRNVGGHASSVSAGNSSGGKKSKGRFNHPCTRFNTREGCSNENCKFQPICSVKGCRGPHPKYEHPAQEFRKAEVSQESGS
jgi:hypothetical protein